MQDILRSVLTAILARRDGFIARNPHIATADLAYGIGGLAGLSYTSTSARSMRSVFCELLRRLRCSPELTTDEAGTRIIPMPASPFPTETLSWSSWWSIA
jgi:hypothetical protein